MIPILRDEGPRYALESSAPKFGPDEQRNPDPEGGILSKSLHGHPIMRYFAVSAATIAATGVAASLVKKGGIRLGAKLEEGGIPFIRSNFQTNLIHDVRSVRDSFNAWETAVIGGPAEHRGFYLTEAEHIDSSAGDVFKRSLQRSLFKNARELPYMVPAMYAVQKTVNEPLFGHDPKQKPVKWYNPFDVIGDFTRQSVKNLAINILPFEAGGPVIKDVWHKYLGMGNPNVAYQGAKGAVQNSSIVLQSLLASVGHDSGQILASAAKYSQAGGSAFAAGLDESINSAKGLVQHLNEVRNKNSSLTWAQAVKQAVKDPEFGDVQFGPFGGMKSFGTTFRDTYRNAIDAAKVREQVLHGMRKLTPSERSTAAGLHYQGTSTLQEIAESVFNLVGDDVEDPRSFGGSRFFKGQMTTRYKRLMEKELRSVLPAGTQSDRDIAAFLRKIEVTNVGELSRGPEGLRSNRFYRRVQLGDAITESYNREPERYLAEFNKRLKGARISDKNADIISSNIGSLVRRTDRNLHLNYGTYSRQIKEEFDAVYSGNMLRSVKGKLGHAKVPFEALGDDLTPEAASILVKALGEKYGMPVHNMSESAIRSGLKSRGVNMFDSNSFRGALVDAGLAAPPHHKGGFNLFGFRQLTADRAMERDFFGHMHPRQRAWIGRLVSDIENNEPGAASLGRLRVGRGIYETRSGKIVDFSGLYRGGRTLIRGMSDRIQIPFIHLQPLNTLGFSAYRTMSEGQFFRYSQGYTGHFGVGGPADESHLWMRARGAKGSVVGFNTVDGALRVRNLEGLYRHHAGDAASLIGRQLRAAAGEEGRFGQDNKSRFQRMFGLKSEHESMVQSFRSRLEAFRTHRAGDTDLTNPMQLARRLINDPEFLATASPEQRTAAAKGWLNLERDLSRTRISARAMRRLDEVMGESSPFNHPKVMFKRAVTASGKQRDMIDMLEHGSIDEHARFARQLLHEDSQFSDPAVRQTLNRAQSRLWESLNQQSAGYFEQQAPMASRNVGIGRRADEFREQLKRYLVIRQAAINSDGGAPIQELLQGLELARGRLTGSEYQEARAAILGTQIDFMRARQEPGRRDLQQSLMHLMANFAGSGAGHSSSVIASAEMRNALEAYYGGHLFAAQSQYNGPGSFLASKVRSRWHSNFGKVDNYDGYNPFGGNSTGVMFPTFGTAFKRHPFRATASALNLTNWSDPDAFSGSSLPLGHVFTRLNRYFEALGVGVDESNYKGGADFFARGMVGRVVLPAVAAGTTLTALDATAGGWLHRRDRSGKRVYSPLVMGWGADALAHGQAITAGVMPGGKTYSEKRDELFEGEVPVRRGRWWALGNTPWSGGRIMYYRPSWYRRFKSGYKYTDDTFGSPMERLMYGHDFSPLRPLDPYRFEREHYKDRPYPVTGEYFTGPWGPVTSALNATVGRLLKRPKRMHEAEVERQLGGMQAIGQYGMQSPYAGGPDQTGFMYMKVRGRPTVTTPAMASDVMNYNYLSGQDLGSVRNRGIKNRLKKLRSPFRAPRVDNNTLLDRPYYNLMPGGEGGYAVNTDYGVNPQERQAGYRVRADIGGGDSGAWRRGGNFTGRSSPMLSEYFIPGQVPKQSASAAQHLLRQINQQYESASDPNIPTLNRDTFNNTAVPLNPTFGSRVMPRSRMTTQTSMPVIASQFGYEMQELSGIYGFSFGSSRQALGYGNQDISPRRPVLLSASRAYGSERSFWDMNLGGLGDAPLPFGGEFSNLEFSEIARRFIPHRRRDIREVNPIANSMGKKHKWLPGSDYFINFHEGDPFSLIPEGEMRLPGKAYERLNKLHPDATGKYGAIDRFKILGDVAPYSQEYRAMSQVMRKGNIHLLEPMPSSAPREARAARNKEEAALWKEIAIVKKKVANKNKRVSFSNYTHVGQSFKTTEATITGRVENSADKFYTDAFKDPIRLAGVRARGEKAVQYIDKVLGQGDKVQLTYDANMSPLANNMGVIDAIVTKQGQDVSSRLLDSGFGHASTGKQTPLEAKRSEGSLEWSMNYLKENLAHRDTFVNKKFFPKRTPVEDWERNNVYGSSFPQWQDPVKDFLMPAIYKSMNRNPIIATAAMSVVGAMFGVSTKSVKVGAFLGGLVGFGASVFTNADKLGFNERFIPMRRKQEIGVEEYTDILKYVKFSRLYGDARAAAMKVEGVDPEAIAQELDQYRQENSPAYAVGPITGRALQYRKEVGRTLYGADPYGDVMDLYQAMPKRKRDHFMEFINNPPVRDRKRILSTAGRLERRVYEAKWGLKVERRPDLNEYFQSHELPDASWEGWQPDVPLEAVKLKIIQHQGLDASEMGYYPQQVQEANLLNPSYPQFSRKSSSGAVAQQLRALMDNSGISGGVTIMPSPYPGSRVQFDMGVS